MTEKRKVIFSAVGCMIVIIIAAVFFSAPEAALDNLSYPTGGEEMTRNRRISATYARELMERYPNAIILDVRTESEFDAGHIPGAVLLPDFEISERTSEILRDYDALILVYCRSGARSRAATSLLVSMGYVNVYDFGGINSWPYEIEN